MTKGKDKISLRLNAFVFDRDVTNFEDLLDPKKKRKTYALKDSFGITGAIYIKERTEGRPKWAQQLDILTGSPLADLSTTSASAVLFVKTSRRVVAYTFGYGRYLLNDSMYLVDFGIRTALNTLDNTTLRSVDLYSLEQQPIQKRMQAIQDSNISAFGIDVSRDILKAVTGRPKAGVEWENIHGADGQLSFTVYVKDLNELSDISEKLCSAYDSSEYKTSFAWVDNIQRVKNDSLKSILDGILTTELQSGVPTSLQLAMPNISNWDQISGFSFTNAKREIKTMLDKSDYFSANPAPGHTIEKLKSNRLFCYDMQDNETDFSIYSCLYFECTHNNITYILFSSNWFSIDQEFLAIVKKAVNEVPVSKIAFPPVTNIPAVKKTATTPKKKAIVETEGDYNERVSKVSNYLLFDKKLIKPRINASSIELCDLLTPDSEFIHVKHKKGGSAGMSHLFAQGRVSAELLLSDQEFRKDARAKLPKGQKDLISADKFEPSKCAIVFLILGEDSKNLVDRLPFFSKVNLWQAYQSLTQRNYKVSIAGAPLA